MKKIYTLASFILVSGISFAQVSDASFPEPTDISTKILKSKKVYSSSAAKSTPFWSEDFSGGIPATWTDGSTQILPVISAPWVYRGPSTTPDISIGSEGAYAGSNGPIASATASDGFMLFDSDYYDNGGTPGNFGQGAYPCNSIASGGAPTGHVGTLTTDSIDCSIYPDISIIFHSFYREYTGIAKLAFSLDGGLTFTDTIEVHPEIEVNERTENDYQVMLRMPLNIAGNTNVKIQFIYDGTILYNTSYNGYYFWMIDDIELVETPPHLLDLSSETFGGWWIGYEATGDIGTDFTFYPKRQAIAQPYRFESVVFNNGSEDQSNVKMNVEVESSGSNVYTGASAPITIITNTNDTLATTTNFTPTLTGVHEITLWASSDSLPSSDTITRSTIVTDTVYGVDYDWNSDGANAQGGYFLGKPCGGQVLGNVFDIYAVDTVTSISFHVSASSAVGNDVKVVLYDIDDPEVIDPISLAESDDYTLLPTDTNKWITLKLLDPYPVTAGIAYLAAVKGTISLQDTTLISSSSNENSSSWLQDNCVATDPASTHVPGDWYSIGADGLLIRLNFGVIPTPSGINNIKQSQFNLYPNPTDGVFVIELEENSKYDVTVIDILGKTVYTSSINNMNTTIDLSGFDKGVYTVELKDENSKYTEKLIVE